jgi:hypothetical protein
MGQTTIYFCDHCQKNVEKSRDIEEMNLCVGSVHYRTVKAIVSFGKVCEVCRNAVQTLLEAWIGNDLE